MTTTAPSSPPAAPPASWVALGVILIGVFMTTLDFFIVNVAMPSLAVDLHASAASLEWVIAGYAIALGGGLIIGARLGDIFGQRTLFMIGMIVFTLASVACGEAQTATLLVVARVVQGAGAALLTPQVLALIGALYAGGRRHRAFTIYGITLGLAAVTGQLIGGLLIQANLFDLGWRTCFLINVPVGIATLIALPLVVPAYRSGGDRQLDLPGALLGTAAISAAVLALIQGRQFGWPPWIWACLALGVVTFAGFIWYQRRRMRDGRAPLVNLSLFARRPFAVASLTMFAFFISNAPFYFFLSQYLQGGLGLSPLEAGALFGLMGAAYFMTALRPAWLVARFGDGWIPAGVLTMMAGMAVMFVPVLFDGARATVPMVLPGMLVAGLGVGMVLGPLSQTVMQSVAPEQAGAASGIVGAVQQIGNSLGIAIIGLVFFNRLGDAPVRSDFASGYAGALVGMVVVLMVVALLSRWLMRLVSVEVADATASSAPSVVEAASVADSAD